ncbi:Circadian input kinase A [Geitlerinema sp. FC II]|nr:Circadian input kinase A [Geitlerinema sp. FC II]
MINQILTSHNNPDLVLLSVFIAVLASYTAFDLTGRVRSSQGRDRRLWLWGGSVAMGTGIWAMHFIGTLAFEIALPIRYNPWLVFASVLPAVLASGVALFLVSRPTLDRLRRIGGSLAVTTGIASMHYLTMAATQVRAQIQFDRLLVGVSIALTIAISFIVLSLADRWHETPPEEGRTQPWQIWQKWGGAIAAGLAVTTVHYTGTAAVTFTSLAPLSRLTSPVASDTRLWTVAVSLGTLVVLSLTLLAAFFDRRLTAQAARTHVLQESQNHLNRLLQGVRVGILIVAVPPEGRPEIQTCNQAAIDLLGTPAEELHRYWEPSETTHLERSTLAGVFHRIAAHQTVRNAIVSVDRPDLEDTVWLIVDAVATKETDGRHLVVCTFSDISDLKRVETLLKQSESRFKQLAQRETLLNSLSSQIRSSLDPNTILRTLVREVRGLLNTDRVVIYKFNPNWDGTVVVEDIHNTRYSILDRAISDDCFPSEYAQLYEKGRVRAIDDVTAAGLDPCHVEFLQSLSIRSQAIVPILSCDRLWGLLIAHECCQTRVWEDEEVELLERLAVQAGVAIQQAELYAQATDNATTARSQARQLARTLHELKQTQSQLIQTEKMSSLGQLVAGIAHEINNPVNFIYGNLTHADTYTRDLLDLVELYHREYQTPTPAIAAREDEIELEFLVEDLPKILSSMKVGADRIRKIILSLRNFSRLDEAEIKDVDVRDGIQSTLTILQYRLKAKSDRPAIEVVCDYHETPRIECYSGPLNQVFMNLLTNAIDALEEKMALARQTGQNAAIEPPKICIHTEKFGTNQIRIRISDNGLGISQDASQRLFDPFFTTKPVGKGTGLGLAISYQIVTEKHGGSIYCNSELGKGTTFSIELPVRLRTAVAMPVR